MIDGGTPAYSPAAQVLALVAGAGLLACSAPAATAQPRSDPAPAGGGPAAAMMDSGGCRSLGMPNVAAGGAGAGGGASNGAAKSPMPALVAGFPASQREGSLSFGELRVQDRFWGEGAALADLDQDGHVDVVTGPWAWAGPDFTAKWQFRDYDTGMDFFDSDQYDPFGMADSWAVYAYDVNGDGRPDLISKGHPGHAVATWYENTGRRDKYAPHVMHSDIAFEQNLFFDITGDGRPELIAGKQGRVGFVAADWSNPGEPWTFHGVSEAGPWGNGHNFYHGVGVGDMNQDGRVDLLHNTGWDEQPTTEAGSWQHHDGGGWPGHTTGVQFGGAHMFGYDVDGDGDTDLVTSLNSHGYGLAWWEQTGDDWKRHLIFGAPGEISEHPDITISQVHAIALADMDGDGLLDIVTGKSYWAHPDQPGTPASEDVRGTPYLYVFRLARKPGQMFEAHLVSHQSGVGRQFAVGDVNADGVLDIVVGNKLGTFVYTQRSKAP